MIDPDLFWSKVDIGAPDACWPYRRGKAHGYGMFWVGGRNHGAHRVAFLLVWDHWPEPCALHTCDNPACCNPGHIWEGTKGENNADRARKGRSGSRRAQAAAARSRAGDAHHNAKLTRAGIVELRQRRAGGESLSALARDYGVSRRTVRLAIEGTTYAWSDGR